MGRMGVHQMSIPRATTNVASSHKNFHNSDMKFPFLFYFAAILMYMGTEYED